MELERHEFIINDRFYLDILVDDEEDKLYYNAQDLSSILAYDVLKLIKKEHEFFYENEIFINQDGFNYISYRFPDFFKYWYYTNIFKPM